MKKICDTERLTLRTMTIDDAAFYHALVTDPSYVRIIGDTGVRTLEQARALMTEKVLVPQAQLGYSRYVIALHDGTPIGSCGLVKRDTLDCPDLGYAYLPAYWGRGYAVEAARAVVAHARRDIGMTRLLGITSPSNTASIGVLTKIGFRFERITQLHENDSGTNVYSLDLR